MDRRQLIAAGLAAPLVPTTARAKTGPVSPDESFELWPGVAPGLRDRSLTDHVRVRSDDPAFPDRAMERIARPRLDVFRPKTPNGAAVLVMPGGAYRYVVVDKEGYEIAPWLAARGYTVFVLFYRLPGDAWHDAGNVPLADAQRAMRLIRARAARLRIDPAKVAALGFSAGGHLCADLATRFGRKVYSAVDAADAGEARPVAAAGIYPVISLDPAITHSETRRALIGTDADAALTAEHSPDRQVNQATPPFFLLHAEDDPAVSPENSLRMRAALRQAGVPVDTHLFQTGGHGFGLRTAGKPIAAWPDLLLGWLQVQGLR